MSNKCGECSLNHKTCGRKPAVYGCLPVNIESSSQIIELKRRSPEEMSAYWSLKYAELLSLAKDMESLILEANNELGESASLAWCNHRVTVLSKYRKLLKGDHENPSRL